MATYYRIMFYTLLHITLPNINLFHINLQHLLQFINILAFKYEAHKISITSNIINSKHEMMG